MVPASENEPPELRPPPPSTVYHGMERGSNATTATRNAGRHEAKGVGGITRLVSGRRCGG
jgi:hypothetical protein